MRRSSRTNAVRFESLEEALSNDPETYGHIDVLCGGFPCQDVSIAGSRAGFKGARSSLWREYRRIIGLFLPEWVIVENVPGLFSSGDVPGQDFWEVVADIDSFGYCVAWAVLDSQFFGVAQRRKRVFIVGSLGHIGASKIFHQRESIGGDFQAVKEMGPVGACLSTRDGERNDPSSENIVAYTLETDLRGTPFKLHTENLVAETHSGGEGEASRVSVKLDSMRGIVIGNAVTVDVAEWIGRRILEIKRGG